MKSENTNAIAAAQGELDSLAIEKYRIDTRILRLKQTIEMLSGLSEEHAADDIAIHSMNAAFELELGIGLTDAIRTVLGKTNVPDESPLLSEMH